MDPMTSRLASVVSLAVLLSASAACTSTSPGPTGSASPTDPDSLLRTVLIDYNDRNNVALAAANALDATKWKLADTGPALEADLVANVFRSHEAAPERIDPFDMVAVRQLGAPVISGQARALLGVIVAGPRGSATAGPATSSATTPPPSATTSGTAGAPSSVGRRKMIVLTQADAGAPWLLQMSGWLPDSLGDLGTVGPATEAERSAAVSVVKAVTDYLTNGDVSAGVDLGMIPAERSTVHAPAWGQKQTEFRCAVDTDASGAPLVQAAATGLGVLGVGAFHCTYTLTYAKASAVPTLLDEQKQLWGAPTGATLSIPLRGGVTLRVPVDGGRPQILWWLLDDGMARALIPAARG